jgi:WD40 repeat protein
MIGSAGADYAIKIWNLKSGLEIKASDRHSNYIEAIAFSPVDNVVASASWDKTIKLWDTTTGKLITTLRGHQGGVSSVAFSSDGKVIASGSWINGESWDNTIRFWDALGRPLKVLQSSDAKTLSEVASAVPDLYRDYYLFSISPDGSFQVSLGEKWSR